MEAAQGNLTMRLVKWWCAEWPTILAIVLGIGIQLLLITQGFQYALTHFLPDDAFFYYKLAENVAAGLGPTFDGLQPTNGFHPLWLLILAFLYKAFPSPYPDLQPIVISMWVQVAFNAVTALLVARILTRFSTSPWIRAFGMAIWMFNPFLIYESINGLETPLMLCMLTLFFLLALRVEENRAIGGYWLLGIIGALLVLSRIDTIFYPAAVLVWLAIRNDWFRGYEKTLSYTVAFIIPLIPWFAWNYLNFHMILTSAANAESAVNHGLVYQDNGPGVYQFLKGIVYNTQYILDDSFKRTGMFTIGAGFVGAWMALMITGFVALPRKIREIPVSVYLFAGYAALFFADASIRWVERTWYFIAINLFMTIVTVVVLNALFPKVTYKKIAGVVLLTALLFSFGVDWSKNYRGANNALGQQDQLEANGYWMHANLPSDTKVGSFAPGIQGYFSDVHLIGLDGLVDDQVAAALENHALWRYMRQNDVTYLWNYTGGLEYRFKSFIGVSDPFMYLTRTDATNASSSLQLYRVNFGS